MGALDERGWSQPCDGLRGTNDSYTIIKGGTNATWANLGTLRGRLSTDWGPTLFTNGRWDAAGGTTLYWGRDANTSQYATGKIQFLLLGHWLSGACSSTRPGDA